MRLRKASRPAGGRRRWPRRTLLGTVVVLGLLYGAGALLTGSRLPANATIAGVDVGAMTPAAAQQKLAKTLAPKANEPMTFAHGEQRFDVEPSAMGVSLDARRSVEEAGGRRSWNPVTMMGLLLGDHDFAPVVGVDESKFADTAKTLADAINREVVEAQITFTDATPAAREPKAGLAVDRDATIAAVKAAYAVSDQPIAVPTLAVEPAVDSAALATAMADFGEPAMSGPVTLQVGDRKVPLPTAAFAPALIVAVEDGVLTPSIDAKKLKKPLTDSTTGIGAKAVDATFRTDGKKAVVVPGKVGLGLQPEEMATALIPILAKTGAERSLTIKAKAVEPDFSTADAEKLGIKTNIGTFTTYYAPAAYRDINQGRAAQLLDGTIVKPGETFSFNDTVGERTVANGFTVGTVINGGVFREELGGGVSQVVTTTYNAAFFAGMTDVEHHPHDLYISRYPVGREATVYWGSLDMKFRNDSKYGVLIRAAVQKSAGRAQGAMTVSLYSTKVYDIKAGLSAKRNIRNPSVRYDPTDRCVPQSPSIGFDVDVYRYFYQNGTKVKTETDTAHYRATDDVRCRAKPKDDDKP